jgi:uncharacterized membrane-anchored protein
MKWLERRIGDLALWLVTFYLGDAAIDACKSEKDVMVLLYKTGAYFAGSVLALVALVWWLADLAGVGP